MMWQSWKQRNETLHSDWPNIALAGLTKLYNFEINFIFNQLYISKRVIVDFMLTIY
jgi:hypothetical protein